MGMAHRVGDPNTEGGVALVGAGTVFINGIPAAKEGNPVSCHPPFGPLHCPDADIVKMTTGHLVYIEGVPAITEGDVDSCGHARAAGSGNTNIG
jgi:uncharacterized Zn-binding protein involved in type VI secretion